MLGKAIKLYRLERELSRTQLAKAAKIKLSELGDYEENKRMPDLKTTRSLAEALNVSLADLIEIARYDNKYKHCEFRKLSRLKKSEQELLRAKTEEYLDKFLSVAEILGKMTLREAPEIHSLSPNFNVEEDAQQLRKILGFSSTGAIPNIISFLEDKGILIFQMKYRDNKFSGMNGQVNGRPYNEKS